MQHTPLLFSWPISGRFHKGVSEGVLLTAAFEAGPSPRSTLFLGQRAAAIS